MRSGGANSARVARSQGVQFSKSPMLAVSLPPWRSRVVLFVLFAAFAALGIRAMWLQGLSTQFLQDQGELRYGRTLELPATRGKIMDRDSQVLASSAEVRGVWGVPGELLKESPERLRMLANLLELDERELRDKLEAKQAQANAKRLADEGRNEGKSDGKNDAKNDAKNDKQVLVYLKRQVELSVAKQISALKLDGIEMRKEYKRYYPQGGVMSHVIGFNDLEDVGQEGMEKAQQEWLKGKPGSRRVTVDRLGHIVEDGGTIIEPHEGKDLALSLDSKIQYIAFTQLKNAVDKFKAKAGAAIVLDVHTGEVLALANYPTFEPKEARTLRGKDREVLRNHVITDTFEPGSTLKPFTVALGLDSGRYKPTSYIDTGAGKYTILDRTISDTKGHGVISVQQIIEMSSNIGTSKIALSMPSQEMWEMFTKVGFGQQPKWGFPGAQAGRVRPYKSWRPIEQATMSYGNGISVSLIQLARAYLVFARDGDIIPLSFQKVTKPPVGTQVIKPQTARQMREMLEAVVSGKDGTAKQAQIPGYRAGGKTGTAYKVENGRYAMPRKYIGSFAGLVPMSNPRFVIAVMIDEPTQGGHYGGQVAAPTFAAVAANALRSMNVPPDSNVTEIIVPADTGPEAM